MALRVRLSYLLEFVLAVTVWGIRRGLWRIAMNSGG
jgi:hypothetical protein